MAKAIPVKGSERYIPLIRSLSRFVEWPFDVRGVTKGTRRLTPKEKAFITQRHKEVYGYTGSDGHYHGGLNDDGLEFYSVKAPKRRITLQKAVHQRYVSKHYKGAFILTAGQKPDVKWKGNEPIIDLESVTLRYIDFDQRRLIKDPAAEVKRATDSAPEAKSFKIQCGEHSSGSSWPRSLVGQQVIKWMNEYKQGGSKYKKGNHYKKWLGGVIAFNFKNQKSFKRYLNDKAKHQKAKLAKNRKARKARNGSKKGAR